MASRNDFEYFLIRSSTGWEMIGDSSLIGSEKSMTCERPQDGARLFHVPENSPQPPALVWECKPEKARIVL
jgi:hypothetical protein